MMARGWYRSQGRTNLVLERQFSYRPGVILLFVVGCIRYSIHSPQSSMLASDLLRRGLPLLITFNERSLLPMKKDRIQEETKYST